MKPLYKEAITVVCIALFFTTPLWGSGICPYEPTEMPTIEYSIEPPFSEIIPNSEDLLLNNPFYNLDYCYFKEITEATIYYPDGSIGYYRMFANEAACNTSSFNEVEPEDEEVLLSMKISIYQDEEQAAEVLKEERLRSYYDKNTSEFYSTIYNLPLEDIVSHDHFWQEPYEEIVQGVADIFFKIGNYVGNCKIWINEPPKLDDGYFIPPSLSSCLENAAMITISRIREQ